MTFYIGEVSQVITESLQIFDKITRRECDLLLLSMLRVFKTLGVPGVGDANILTASLLEFLGLGMQIYFDCYGPIPYCSGCQIWLEMRYNQTCPLEDSFFRGQMLEQMEYFVCYIPGRRLFGVEFQVR